MSTLDDIFRHQMHMLDYEVEAIFREARRDMAKKVNAWKSHFARRCDEMRARLTAGEITLDEYRDFLGGQVFTGRRWANELEEMTQIMVDADRAASRAIARTTGALFVEGANYAAYELESSIGAVVNFTLFDETTVARLVRDNPQILPQWRINEAKDYVWNAQRVQNAVTQGIIQGESVSDIGARLTEDLMTSNTQKMEMFARTAVTGAQNAGRQERMEEAEDELEDVGVEVQKMWVATLDDRTRDAHQELDGVTVGVHDSFHNSVGDIRFPGDPLADPANTYNCRCTLEYVYPQFPRERQRRAYREVEDEDGTTHRESYIVGDLTYAEWRELKSGESD